MIVHLIPHKPTLTEYKKPVLFSLDSEGYTQKPTGAAIGAIRNRLSGNSAHASLPIGELAKQIEHGHTIQGARLRDKKNENDTDTDKRFLDQQLFAVDIDNDYKDKATGQKYKIPQSIDTPEQILAICDKANITPCIISESFSSGKKDPNGHIINKYHVLFAADKPITSNSEARQIINGLQQTFGAVDKACADPARILFGTSQDKNVHVCSAVNSAELLLSLYTPEEPAPAEPIPATAPKSQSTGTTSALVGVWNEQYQNFEADPDVLLQMIDTNTLSYEEFRSITASHKAAGGSDDIWEAWADNFVSEKYSHAEVMKQNRKTRKGMHGKKHTVGTLKDLCEKYAPDTYNAYMQDLNEKSKEERKRRGKQNARTASKAPQSGEHSAENIPVQIIKEPSDNPYNKDGSGMLTEENMWEALRIQNISIRFNEILHTPEIQGKCLEQRYVKESFSAVLPVYLYDVLKKNHLKSVTVDKISGYINNILFSKQSVCNPILESIHAANWNGTDKLSELYTLMHISEQDTLSRVLLKKWLMQCYCALHNNINNPFPVEYVLVLVGKQGFGKTMLLEKLALNRRYFGEGKCFDPRDKDTKIQATSKWITELGEIGSTMKKDMDLVKAFISDRVDEYRVPYGKTNVQYVRRTSLCGSTNDMQFLIDETGNRRFLTVKLPDNTYIDAKSKEFKEFDTLQLWRQIKHIVDEEIKNGAEYSSAFRLTREEQEQLDARNLLHSKPLKGEIEISEILSYNLMAERGFELGEEHITTTEFINKYSELRGISAVQAGKVLKKLGYNKIQMKIGGIPTSVYKLPYKKWINNNSAYNP